MTRISVVYHEELVGLVGKALGELVPGDAGVEHVLGMQEVEAFIDKWYQESGGLMGLEAQPPMRYDNPLA